MISSGIYCIINLLNNKLYIGSSQNITNRLSTHFYLLRVNKHHNLHLQNSYNKYGADKFTTQVIEYVQNINELETQEQKWIDYYKSIGRDLYNQRDDVKSNKGFKHSEKSRKERSASMIGNKRFPGREIEQIDKTTGEVINTFSNFKEAGKVLQINTSHISCACVGRRKSAGGFSWRYI